MILLVNNYWIYCVCWYVLSLCSVLCFGVFLNSSWIDKNLKAPHLLPTQPPFSLLPYTHTKWKKKKKEKKNLKGSRYWIVFLRTSFGKPNKVVEAVWKQFSTAALLGLKYFLTVLPVAFSLSLIRCFDNLPVPEPLAIFQGALIFLSPEF